MLRREKCCVVATKVVESSHVLAPGKRKPAAIAPMTISLPWQLCYSSEGEGRVD